jgi:hypothetical protein
MSWMSDPEQGRSQGLPTRVFSIEGLPAGPGLLELLPSEDRFANGVTLAYTSGNPVTITDTAASRVIDLAWDTAAAPDRLTSERQRFTILHEAIHTYCPGFLEAQFRCNPNESEGRVEALCDHGASELLLPRRFFGPELTDLGLTIDTLIELAPRCVASVEATGIRAVDLWQGPASLLVFRNRHKPSDAGTEDVEPKLRLDWSHTSGRWPYLRRYKSVSDGSPFADAMLGEVVERVSNLAELTGDADRLYQVSSGTLICDASLRYASATKHSSVNVMRQFCGHSWTLAPAVARSSASPLTTSTSRTGCYGSSARAAASGSWPWALKPSEQWIATSGRVRSTRRRVSRNSGSAAKALCVNQA